MLKLMLTRFSGIQIYHLDSSCALHSYIRCLSDQYTATILIVVIILTRPSKITIIVIIMLILTRPSKQGAISPPHLTCRPRPHTYGGSALHWGLYGLHSCRGYHTYRAGAVCSACTQCVPYIGGRMVYPLVEVPCYYVDAALLISCGGYMLFSEPQCPVVRIQ